jgi:CDP-diacylglycerol--serine O-phosphatidyltransferase
MSILNNMNTNVAFKHPRPRGIYILPNLFTIGSLFAGFFSIISSFKGVHDNAAIAILIAMIMDGLDGRIARLTNTMTAFGAELDSLADMVSFAVAPAVLAYTWGLFTLGKFGWLSAFVYMIAVALRLARFNTQIESTGKRYFQGLSCTAAAGVITSFIWMCCDCVISNSFIMMILAGMMIIIGGLMVSNIRFRSFKDFSLKDNVSFIVILTFVLVVVLVSLDPPKTLFVISGPITTAWGLHQKRRLRKKQISKKMTNG